MGKNLMEGMIPRWPLCGPRCIWCVKRSRFWHSFQNSSAHQWNVFRYRLNLCCGTAMFRMLELAPFYVPTPYFRPPTFIATLGASVQIRVPLCFHPFEHPTYVDVVKFEYSFHDRVDRFGQPINRVSFNEGILVIIARSNCATISSTLKARGRRRSLWFEFYVNATDCRANNFLS